MPDRSKLGQTVGSQYSELVAMGTINADVAQIELAGQLDELNGRISAARLAVSSSSLGWLFAKKAPKKNIVRGLYIHGSVGRGKTMLMDFFFKACPEPKKRRAHFHDFMADVHDRIGAYRQKVKDGLVKDTDPISPVAEDLAKEAKVICFDEFSVTDIADAMILSRLFTALFQQGVVLVATSNVTPDNLYKDGLNRSLFTPFIDILKNHTDVTSLDAHEDYRLSKLAISARYFWPLGAVAETGMDNLWAAIAGPDPRPSALDVKGRKVIVPQAGLGAARFSFSDLCAQPLGARDYMALARAYHTVFIDGVPIMDETKRNEAKRFINLIDTLYDTRTKLVISAQAEPTKLYVSKSGTEGFEFDRTASRLIEMRSDSWMSH
ncbi:MAG: cell division protein ZapE [Ahrensia sp.]|nr:cell division protein ZapE [Ahrensia sp.]